MSADTLGLGTPPVIGTPVFDGGTGAVIEVDGEKAILVEDPVLIEVPVEDLIHDLVVIDRRLVTAREDSAEAKLRVKNLAEAREQILSRLKDHDDGTKLLPFEPGPDETFEDPEVDGL